MLNDKLKIIFNSQMPTAEIFYARSIGAGIAAYADGNTLITKEALDRMNPTFAGKPVVITHKDWEKQAPVGYVVKSFWLPEDGYYWVEFIIMDDVALNFIKHNKVFVSNGYEITEIAGGGTYHQIEYADEVINGKYLHLALTEKPKFKEAIVLTKKEFKEFNEKLSKIDNKFNEEEKMKFFKKKEIENSEDILKASFELDGKEMTVESMINTLKTKLNEENAKIKVSENVELSKDELIAKYNELNDKLNEKETEDKRKLIDEIGGILKDKVDNEVWKTVIGKVEKLAYNSCENEEDKKAREAKEAEEKKNEEEKKKAEEEAKKKAEEEAKTKENEAEELRKRLEKLNEANKIGVEKWQLVNGKLTKIIE